LEVSKSFEPEVAWQGGPVYRTWGGGGVVSHRPLASV
jgi:hypothetical protein